jgi:hypothetical protein
MDLTFLADTGRDGHVTMASSLDSVLQEYGRALETPIHAYAPPNHLSPPRRGGGIHLHVFALPARPHRLSFRPVAPTIEMPAVISWVQAPETLRALAPGKLFAQGRLRRDAQGRALAGILGENIYLLFDLFKHPEALVPVALRRSLDLCLSAIPEWLSVQTGRLPHQIQATLHRLSHRTTLMTLECAEAWREHSSPPDPSAGPSGVSETDDVIRRRIAVVEDSLKELSRQMALHTRMLSSCRERIRVLKEAEQSEELLVREIEALTEIPGVREVEVQGDCLRVITDTVDTVVAGKRYRLGRFRLDIRFNGDVAIKNLTRAYGYYDHPHVWNAKPCLGNIGHSVPKLVSEFQWVAAAQLLIEYLKTINPKEWYTPIDHWEEVRA